MRRLAAVGFFLCLFVGRGDATPSGGQARREKPRAPVALEVRAIDRGGGRWELRAVATPTLPALAVELEVSSPPGGATIEGGGRARFGVTGAGVARRLVARLRRGPAARIVVVARVRSAGGSARETARVVTLGPPPVPAPAPPQRTVVLPGGIPVAEGRP